MTISSVLSMGKNFKQSNMNVHNSTLDNDNDFPETLPSKTIQKNGVPQQPHKFDRQSAESNRRSSNGMLESQTVPFSNKNFDNLESIRRIE